MLEKTRAERQAIEQCFKHMLVSGADVTLEEDWGGNHCEVVIVSILLFGSRVCASISLLKSTTNLLQVMLQQILDCGQAPFHANQTISCNGSRRAPLSLLAKACGYFVPNYFQVATKAILLLKRGADVRYRHQNGDTLLHTLLKGRRYHQDIAYVTADHNDTMYQRNSSIRQPKLLLVAFIAAGADVYAINNKGLTPSAIAKIYGREREWKRALRVCGYDVAEVTRQSSAEHWATMQPRQMPKLRFEDFCKQNFDKMWGNDDWDLKQKAESDDESDDEAEAKVEDTPKSEIGDSNDGETATEKAMTYETSQATLELELADNVENIEMYEFHDVDIDYGQGLAYDLDAFWDPADPMYIGDVFGIYDIGLSPGALDLYL